VWNRHGSGGVDRELYCMCSLRHRPPFPNSCVPQHARAQVHHHLAWDYGVRSEWRCSTA
jgi:hypothetical protein